LTAKVAIDQYLLLVLSLPPDSIRESSNIALPRIFELVPT
jgi:hypothetical protein